MKKSSQKKEKCINVPSVHLPHHPVTRKEIEAEAKARVSRVAREIAQGISFIRAYPRSVTFFGSARMKSSHPYYKKAEKIASLLAQEGFAIVTGGGPGIMEAANKGGHEAGGSSLGFTIKLPKEQVRNPYVDDSVDFHYFFTRKVSLVFSAEAFLFFPGGFGTLDEFFEIITLIQTHKIPPVPIVLVGKDFWNPLKTFIQNVLYKKFKTISKKDIDLLVILDDEEEILSYVKKAPLRRE